MVAFVGLGFSVVGIDVDKRKVDAVNRDESYVRDVFSERLKALTGRRTTQKGTDSRLTATTDFGVLSDCDVAIICVPTPLSKTRDPDVRYILAATEAVAKHIHPGMLVLLESTTYPGITEELLLPCLEASYVCRYGRDQGSPFTLTARRWPLYFRQSVDQRVGPISKCIRTVEREGGTVSEAIWWPAWA